MKKYVSPQLVVHQFEPLDVLGKSGGGGGIISPVIPLTKSPNRVIDLTGDPEEQ